MRKPMFMVVLEISPEFETYAVYRRKFFGGWVRVGASNTVDGANFIIAGIIGVDYQTSR